MVKARMIRPLICRMQEEDFDEGARVLMTSCHVPRRMIARKKRRGRIYRTFRQYHGGHGAP